MMSFEKKAYQLGMMIDLTPKQIHEALDIYQKVSRDNNWGFCKKQLQFDDRLYLHCWGKNIKWV